ncbi:hypothetical protein HF324_00150 [Chitinophaga oryzae]|uniref:Uncharacterized protein n=1 Tax=Chitinophaga oryzae TaxID=2725414 RepID=A0ABX6L8M9_9BACT|nr:hypothetical protein [Chitinophaga oryzae]QJB36358.1 hypothetical protein HF324_00150 [Chitinophaga oryzae]
MKTFLMAGLLLGCTAGNALCQQSDTVIALAQRTFRDAAAATKKQQRLWGTDLYGPMLLVNTATRELYANMPDSSGLLQKQGDIYTGKLPSRINIANTSLHWEGRHWAMVQLPLPAAQDDRINLIAHELFHRSQPALHFQPTDPTNNHLDKKDGRIYLRLELAALQQAIAATSAATRQQHLLHAMTFRRYRYELYPGADTTENALELNEGIAEFTGMMICNRDKAAAVKHFDKSLYDFLHYYPTFVRSFAYQTIPMYGYLLSQVKPGWNRQLNSQSQLTPLIIKTFGLAVPADVKTAATSYAQGYNGEAVAQEETAREKKIQEQIAAYTRLFIHQPHTELRFEKMNISFNPSNIVPIDGYGTVYPTMRISDAWGILTVTEGALMSKNWDKVIVGLPDTFADQLITGKGWKLELNKGYRLEKNDAGNYALKKQQ